MRRFGNGDISKANMTDQFNKRNFNNQKSNLTFVPALNKAEGLAEARKTLQFERNPSH